MVFSQMMRQVLETQKITQKQMARKMGWTSAQYVCLIASGKNPIPIRKFRRFSKVSGIPVDQILDAYLSEQKAKVMKIAGIKPVC